MQADQVTSPSPFVGEGLGRGGSGFVEPSCGFVRYRAVILVPGVPGRHVTFLVSPRNVTQRRRPGDRALRLRLRVALRFSPETAAAELVLAFQSSTQTVLADYPVSACDARRDLRELVRGDTKAIWHE